MKTNEIKINKILIYIILILICFRMTLLYNYNLFYKMLSICVCCSFVLVWLNRDKINLENIKKNYLIIIYCIIRIISIIINDEKILNIKSFIYEVFFLIIVTEIFNNKNDTIINVAKIAIILNVILNIVSVMYQYIIQRDFSRELFGVYTNPNGLANYTMISMIMYITLLIKERKKLESCIYLIFSLIIILLSESRTPILCLGIYVVIAIVLKKKILSLQVVKNTFMIALNLILISILFIVYLNKFNIYPTEFEKKINDITTNRYYLWKYSILSLEKQPIFGIGQAQIGEYRKECVNEELIDSIVVDKSRVKILGSNNNHNGYIQLLVSDGYLCFFVFMVILWKKIKKIDEKNFLIISTILISNLFENEFILSTSISIFILR